ncbi:M28 family peptidase [Alkalimonas sp. NCh-2]|uniref:M28 family peptidase n=1 Tax=Alkalimonas sp. NCh-2 TaxID=3144846 RepID=UPI0031F70558
MPFSLRYLLFFGWILGVGWHPASYSAQPEPARIAGHMLFLADDLLEGRETGSRGHQIAARYLASQLQAFGLEPLPGYEDFQQQVPIRQSSLLQPYNRMVLHLPDGDHVFKTPQHYFLLPDLWAEQSAVTAEVVFVGYGLVSAHYGLDDYAGLDINGKLVMMLTGLPEHLPADEIAHLRQQRLQEAKARGAIGVIYLYTPKQQQVQPYQLFLHHFSLAPMMSWLTEQQVPGTNTHAFSAEAYLHHDAAAPFFQQAPLSASEVFALVEQQQLPGGFALNNSVTLERRSRHQSFESPNVLAVLPGSDPELRNDYLVVTAHSDHVGINQNLRYPQQAAIHNGAIDNAAGVAIVLEAARVLAAGPAPARSVLFLFPTAEERGLLGADYFVQNPPVPLERVIATLNIDAPLLLFPLADLLAYGADHSSLGDAVTRAAALEALTISPDPLPEQALFTRSDHYRFVEQGIPALFLMVGQQSRDPNIDGRAIWQRYLSQHYHQPSDSIAGLTAAFGGIYYDEGARLSRVLLHLIAELANDRQQPDWHRESFFHPSGPNQHAPSQHDQVLDENSR